jgi:hypothetical protein
MAELKTSVAFSLKDLFSPGMKKAAGAAGDFAGKTLGAIDKVDKAISGTGAKLAAFGLTLSVGAAAKGVIELDHRMTRLGISANASADEVSKLKQVIFDAAQAPDIKVDPSSIISGIDVIINKTNDLQYAQDNIRNIGLAIQATGESGESIGDIFSEFNRFKYTSEQITKIMNDMVAQSNAGSFSLAEFAKAAPQIFSDLNARGLGTAPENIIKANAALQVINAGTKNPTKAVAAFNSVLGEIYDPQNRNNLRRLGIDVKDLETGEFRDLNDIMLDIAEKSKNPRYANMLDRMFNGNSMQAIRSYISHGERMNETLNDLGDTTGLLQKQSANMANTMQANIQNLQTAFNKFADSNLTKPLENLTGLLNKLSEDPERLQRVFKGIAIGIGAIAAVKGIAGITRLVGSLTQLKSGNIDIGGALSMSTAMPVYVTNWGGGTPGMGSGGQFQQTHLAKTQLEKGNPLTNAQNAVKNITPKQYAGAGAGAGLAAAIVKIPQMMGELNEIKQNEELTAKERGKAKGGAIGDATGSIVGAAAGGAAGIAAGAAVGAAVGSVVPVLGTAVGALVGAGIGALGMYLGGKAGRAIGGGIGAAVANDGSEVDHERRRVNHSGHRTSPTRRLNQQNMHASSLPPQITQTGTNITQQKVELGHADINLNVNLTGDRPTISTVMQNNTMPVSFNTGSRVAQRRGGM